MIRLPDSFLARPLAHRGYHDAAQGRVENSPAAIRAAVEAGYGIEIDVQRSADDVAMVFHDYALQRLTGQVGAIQTIAAADLGQLPLTGGNDTIPTLPEVLALVGGKVPLLIEVKDQDGAMGDAVGPLERAVAQCLEGYAGDAAVMSFNPHAIAAFRKYNTTRPVGLVTDPFTADDWPTVPAARRAELAQMPDLASLGCSFISHNRSDLASSPVAQAKADGLNILCWTIRSPEQEHEARKVVDNITFEGYAP